MISCHVILRLVSFLSSIWTMESITVFTGAEDNSMVCWLPKSSTMVINIRGCQELRTRPTFTPTDLIVVPANCENEFAEVLASNLSFNVETWLVSRSSSWSRSSPPTKYLRLDSQLYSYELQETSSSKGINVYEHYAIKSSQYFDSLIDNWDVGSSAFQSNVEWRSFARRNDFQGLELKNAVLPYRQFLIVENAGEDMQGEPRFSGICSEILSAMSGTLNFTVDTMLSDDGSWGLILNNGNNVSGILGMLARREVDIAGVPLVITNKRKTVVDFVIPIREDPTFLHIRYPLDDAIDINTSAYTDVFRGETLTIILVLLVVLGVAIEMNSFLHGGSMRLKDIWLSIMSMALQRDIDPVTMCRKKTWTSERTVYLVTCTFCYLIFTAYGALLTSTMIFSPPRPSILSFKDVVDKGYRVIILRGALVEERFVEAKSGYMRDIYEDMLKDNSDNFFTSSEEAVTKLKADPKAVVFEVASMFEGEPRVQAVDDFSETFSTSVTFALAKDSELKQVFDYQLLKIIQSGLMHRIFMKWGVANSLSAVAKSRTSKELSARPLVLENTFIPFMIVASGCLFGTVLAIVEKAYASLPKKVVQKVYPDSFTY